jgi:hypothetical protein
MGADHKLSDGLRGRFYQGGYFGIVLVRRWKLHPLVAFTDDEGSVTMHA